MPQVITEYPQFFTATNLEWKRLLKPDKYKDIVVNSMRFLAKKTSENIFLRYIGKSYSPYLADAAG